VAPFGQWRETLPGPAAEAVAAALGERHREDPSAPRTGGPAGNARLTAWAGLLLLVLFAAECVTLLALHSMISVHIVLGTVLVPVVLLKTATTGWRIVRYYSGDPAYRQAGPPPLLLRLLGPLVVLTGLAVLGTGLALVPLGGATFDTLVTVAGQRVDALTLHKMAFLAWLVVVGVHTLARLVPAVQIASGRSPRRRRPAGVTWRAAVLAATLAVGVVAGAGVLRVSGDWTGPGEPLGRVHTDDGGDAH